MDRDLPNLIGETYFRTRDFDGMWEFTHAYGEDKGDYQEDLGKPAEGDRYEDLANWLIGNSLEGHGEFRMFQGHNGIRCGVSSPLFVLTSLAERLPPSTTSGSGKV